MTAEEKNTRIPLWIFHSFGVVSASVINICGFPASPSWDIGLPSHESFCSASCRRPLPPFSLLITRKKGPRLTLVTPLDNILSDVDSRVVINSNWAWLMSKHCTKQSVFILDLCQSQIYLNWSIRTSFSIPSLSFWVCPPTNLTDKPSPLMSTLHRTHFYWLLITSKYQNNNLVVENTYWLHMLILAYISRQPFISREYH